MVFMFWPDVIALKEFYNSPLGRIACRHISRHIRNFWEDVRDNAPLGIGFTPPYLASFMEGGNRVFACMPAAQGVIHWPAGSANLSLLSDECDLPFPDNSMRRVLAVHALENSENGRRMMAEIWRVLAPGGRLLAVVPNRRGIWARSPQSPFAYGQPFTHWQLRQLFAKNSFTAVSTAYALFFPPSTGKSMLRAAAFLETMGRNFFPAFGGIIVMEAEKQIYAPALRKARNYSRISYVPAPQAV